MNTNLTKKHLEEKVKKKTIKGISFEGILVVQWRHFYEVGNDPDNLVDNL